MALTRNPLDMLFIGGSGIISHASVERAVRLGHHVTVLNRGQSTTHPLPEDVEFLVADVHDGAAVDEVLRDREFDAVAQFIAFTPDHVARDVARFAGRTGQYVFISSASAYQTPPSRMPVTESTPLRNPFWEYSRAKIACEDLLVARLPGSRASRPRSCARRTPTTGPCSSPPEAGRTWPGSAAPASRWWCTATAPRSGP